MACRLLFYLVTLLCLASIAFGAVSFTAYPTSATVGQTYTLQWTPADSVACTIVLKSGSAANLQAVATLTTTATGGKFQWTVPAGLGTASNYVLQITHGTDVNYSGQFAVIGLSVPAPSSSAAQASSQPAPATSQVATSAPAAASSTPASATYTSTTSSTTNAATNTATNTNSVASAASGTFSSQIASSTATSSASSTSAPFGGSNGLSTGAKAGIGVGVALGCLILGLGAFFLGAASRKKKEKPASDAEATSDPTKPELDGRNMYRHEITPEMAGTAGLGHQYPYHFQGAYSAEAKELDGIRYAPHVELNAQPRPMEMDSQYAHHPPHEFQSSHATYGSPTSPVYGSQGYAVPGANTYHNPQLAQQWAYGNHSPPPQ